MQALRKEQQRQAAQNHDAAAPARMLRLMADRYDRETDEGKWTVGYYMAESLRILATKLENFDRLAAKPDSIGKLIRQLSAATDAGHGANLVISAGEADEYHAALLREGHETVEMITKAGLEVVGLGHDLADARDYIRVLERTIANLADDLEQQPGDPVVFKFVYGARDGVSAAMASDLALAMSAVVEDGELARVVGL